MDGRSARESAPMKSIGPVTIATPGDRQIVVTRIFDAPRAIVSRLGPRPNTSRIGGTRAVCRWRFAKSI